MSEHKCKQENEILKIICEVEKLYQDDFDKWESCYKKLVEAVFERDQTNKTYKRKHYYTFSFIH